jgi:hypothetical protein|tara:strand:- start:462 stop:749 length:288 start_codon:yes stop_codon:yes gene_type:complete
LVERGSAGAGFPVWGGGSEGCGGPVKVCVNAGLISADVIDTSHNKQFIGERFEGLHDTIKSLFLECRWDTKAKEEIEGPHWNGTAVGIWSSRHLF